MSSIYRHQLEHIFTFHCRAWQIVETQVFEPPEPFPQVRLTFAVCFAEVGRIEMTFLQDLLSNGSRRMAETCHSAGEGYSVSAVPIAAQIHGHTASASQNGILRLEPGRVSIPPSNAAQSNQASASDPHNAHNQNGSAATQLQLAHHTLPEAAPQRATKLTGQANPGQPVTFVRSSSPAENAYSGGPSPGHLHQALHPADSPPQQQQQEQQDQDGQRRQQEQHQPQQGEPADQAMHNSKRGPRSQRGRKQQVSAKLAVIQSPERLVAREVDNAVDASSSPGQAASQGMVESLAGWLPSMSRLDPLQTESKLQCVMGAACTCFPSVCLHASFPLQHP